MEKLTKDPYSDLPLVNILVNNSGEPREELQDCLDVTNTGTELEQHLSHKEEQWYTSGKHPKCC